MTDDYAAAFAALGAATLGESGGRPMAPRMRPVWTGARDQCARVPRELQHRRQPRDPRCRRGGAGRFGARRERRPRTGARLLGRGAHDRCGGARPRRARDRRRRPRRRRARGARVPGVLHDDRVARRDQAGAGQRRRPGDGRRRRGRARATGSSATPTASPSSRTRTSTTCSPRAAPAPPKEEHFFEELRAGRTTLQLLSLDDAPIDRG